jgi:hypothetical protein
MIRYVFNITTSFSTCETREHTCFSVWGRARSGPKTYTKLSHTAVAWAPLRWLDIFDWNMIQNCIPISHTFLTFRQVFRTWKLRERVAVAMGKDACLNQNLKATEPHSWCWAPLRWLNTWRLQAVQILEIFPRICFILQQVSAPAKRGNTFLYPVGTSGEWT